MRTASCPLACMVSSTRRAIRRGRNRTALNAVASAIAEKAISRMALSSVVVGREEDGQEDDGADLADRADRQDDGAEGRRLEPRVAEDRHQHAERGRREGDAHELGVRDHARGVEREPDRHAEDEPDQPPRPGQARRGAGDPAQVDLAAREEEERGEPEVGEEVDELVGLGDVEHLGPDHDAEQDLDDHRRDARPAGDVGDDRGQYRDAGDDHERREIRLHRGRLSEGGPRGGDGPDFSRSRRTSGRPRGLPGGFPSRRVGRRVASAGGEKPHGDGDFVRRRW